MLEYEVMAKKRMNDLHRQAEFHHRAHLAASDEKTGWNKVRSILNWIGKTFVAAYRIIVRPPATEHEIPFGHSG